MVLSEDDWERIEDLIDGKIEEGKNDLWDEIRAFDMGDRQPLKKCKNCGGTYHEGENHYCDEED